MNDTESIYDSSSGGSIDICGPIANDTLDGLVANVINTFLFNGTGCPISEVFFLLLFSSLSITVFNCLVYI